MKKLFSIETLKSCVPYIVAIALFMGLSAAYFFPVMQGKHLPQSDDINGRGAARELVEYEEATGECSQWTNSMFGGMPAYQIKADSSSNIYRDINLLSRLGLPYHTMAMLFLYMVGFYLLMLSLKVNKWLSLIGAVAFAFGSYNIIIIIAGHITKAYAIALMPAVVAGVLMVFNGQRIAGGICTMLALGMEVAYNHVQITYYLALALVVLVIAKLVYAVREKTVKEFMVSISVLAGASVLAVLPATAGLWTTYEYGEYSTRGASELSAAPGEKQDKGLDKDYALAWSYGLHETMTLFIPDVVGGASEAIGYDNEAVRGITDQQIRDIVAQQSKYWGGRSFTSGPVYAGAVVCFLFVLACFYYNGREKWWIIAATILSIFLAWGKNFPLFTDFMFDYFPLYNKFRTVEMALVIASMTIPLLAMLGLKELYDNPERIRYEVGKFFSAVGITAGIALLVAAVPELFYSFMSEPELAQFDELIKQNSVYATLQQAIIEARQTFTVGDAVRSAMFVLLASSALWFYSTGKIGEKYALGALALLVLIDLWVVDKRYLSEEHFEVQTSAKANPFALSVADKAIQADKEPHRVLSLYSSPFNDAITSYHHQSVGGYHGAKLRRYQDLIDNYLGAEWSQLRGALQKQDVAAIEKCLSESKGLNMLNTKYLIYNPGAEPLVNPYAQGAAWLVDEVKNVSNADEAIASLRMTDLTKVAVLEGDYKLSDGVDSLSTIERVEYTPERLVYKAKCGSDKMAVFSEIYYPAGWKAFVDGEEVEIMRANYVLRALPLSAGEHEIEFRFEPKSFEMGDLIARIASALVVLLTLGACAWGMYKRVKSDA